MTQVGVGMWTHLETFCLLNIECKGVDWIQLAQDRP
jgi:hypothetical protein